MPDEPTQAPDETQETPEQEAPATPEGTQETPEEVDWTVEGPRLKQRYDDIRPEFDRKSQELAQYEQFLEALADPEQAPELLQSLGYELGDEEGQEQQLDPQDEILSRLDTLEGQLTAEQQEAEMQELQEAEFRHIDQQLAGIQQTAGREFDEEEATTIGILSQQLRDERGVPNVQAAYERLDGLSKARQKQYVEGKKQAAPAPYGQPGSEKVDLRDAQARQRNMARIIESEADDESG